jgi:hypothetical protein
MQTVRIVQAVILMSVLALAASCEVSKAYTSKLFAPHVEPVKDSGTMALKFLDLDDSENDTVNWVKTDITRVKDTTRSTAALDRLSNTVQSKADSTKRNERVETIPAGPMAKNLFPGEVRAKKTRDEK